MFRCSDISAVGDVDIVGDDDDVDALVKKSEGMLKAKRDPGTDTSRFTSGSPPFPSILLLSATSTISEIILFHDGNVGFMR